MILHGDCIEELKKLPENSVDSIVTDPPYGLSFMGKKWDYDVPSKEVWQECLRVLKPGGYLLSFAGTRTQHRMAVNIEDAGFEIRDMIAWVYGSGFPKSLNIGKVVDKLQGNERDILGDNPNHRPSEWEGWGTALKPALEPITVARKPLSEKTVAQNILKWGTGGINIDGSRVGTEGGGTHCDNRSENGECVGHNNAGKSTSGETIHAKQTGIIQGRFPANLIHDGSDEVISLFPNSKSTPNLGHVRKGNVIGDNRTPAAAGQFGDGAWIEGSNYSDSGSAARFFYCAKASKTDRDEGLDTEQTRKINSYSESREGMYKNRNTMQKNNHPTVKPTKLMQYLVKLVTPKGGVVLDPFMGSGSTGKACKLEGFGFIGIEREEEYIKIAEARINVIHQQALDFMK